MLDASEEHRRAFKEKPLSRVVFDVVNRVVKFVVLCPRVTVLNVVIRVESIL